MCRHTDIYFFRREEVASEAQRVLRTFPTKSLEKDANLKPMPSFPDMVAYVQEKVSPPASHCPGGTHITRCCDFL